MPKMIWGNKSNKTLKPQTFFLVNGRKHRNVLMQRSSPDINKKVTLSLPIAWVTDQELTRLNSL